MVAQRDRLRGLQMGEPGHDRCGVFVRAHDERNLQRVQPGIGLIEAIAHPQAEIGRHLVIAAARSVQPPRHRADQFGQPAFGGHVDVFQIPVFGHATGGIFRRDLVQPCGNRRRIGRRNDALRAQHRHMRL